MRRYAFAMLLGLSGAAVLIGLGIWQVQRLAWKEGILAKIEAKISADPVALPARPDATRDQYLPVLVEGRFEGKGLRVLASLKQVGAGYRLIAAFQTSDGRKIMVDRGFQPIEETAGKATGPATIRGNLHWPDEVDSYTPSQPDKGGLWFARDVPAMANFLATEPVLVVTWAADPADTTLIAIPVDTTHIPNDHLSYAITWFSLAVVWLGMTLYLLWRIRQRTA
jgi:surfeit locus 1 family protein